MKPLRLRTSSQSPPRKARRGPRGQARSSTPQHADWWQRGTAIGGLASVLLVAVGLYLTNDFNRDQLQLQRDSSNAQQDLALKAQRADRFIAAVDQLGQEGEQHIGIRLGGIYALETLMRDSSEDENTVIEVLCAFVRTHAPRPKSIPKDVSESPADVRAAVTVLSRRPNPSKHANLDFSNTLLGLSGMDLTGGDLSGANLRQADLGNTKLLYAQLSGSDFTGADLSNSNLSYAVLDQTELESANLTAADLTRVSLSRAHAAGALFVGTQMFQANLVETSLVGANLREAYLVSANLENAALNDSDLTQANLSEANIRGAALLQTKLSKADLHGAKLNGAFLTGADLTGADLPPR